MTCALCILLDTSYFLTSAWTWIIADQVLLLASISSAPLILARAWPGVSEAGSAAPGQDAVVCNCHCVPVITTSALTRVARPRPDMASSATLHIILSLLHRGDMKIIIIYTTEYNWSYPAPLNTESWTKVDSFPASHVTKWQTPSWHLMHP